MKSKIIKVFETLTTIFLLIVVILMIYSQIQVKRDASQIPSILGYRYMTVLTGSMQPLINPGDIVVSRIVKPVQIEIGDVITYKINSGTLVTHRVTDIVKQGKKLMFRTKGDYNNTLDSELVSKDQLIGRVLFRIPKVGYVAKFIRTPIGLVLIVLLPFAILIFEEVKSALSKLVKAKKKQCPNDNVKS